MSRSPRSLASTLFAAAVVAAAVHDVPAARALSAPSPLAAPSPAVPQQERGSRGSLDVQQFMQSMLAYGRWSTHPTFGWVWQPHDVQPWWQPFTVGDWIVTQDGSPYWRSALPYGWAVEHYGSWTFDENLGWLWVPGTEWSAAPVDWRARDGVIGWAPRMASTADTQGAPCPQPVSAWIFIAPERLLTTTNFAVAEHEFLARDVHGTWGAWAHEPDGVARARIPEPRNVNLLDVTQCLGAAEAKDVFLAAAKARGLAPSGPPITFVTNRLAMGSGRPEAGLLRVYAPEFTGSAPPQGGPFLVNPPAPSVQRALPIARAQPVPRVGPAGRVAPAEGRPPVQPVPTALPVPPNAPQAPLAPYEAFTYQQESLDEHHANQFDDLRRLHSQDATSPPYPGFDPGNLPAWQKREMQQMQRMSARQRRLLEARQSRVNEELDASGRGGAQAGPDAPPPPPPGSAPAPSPR